MLGLATREEDRPAALALISSLRKRLLNPVISNEKCRVRLERVSSAAWFRPPSWSLCPSCRVYVIGACPALAACSWQIRLL